MQVICTVLETLREEIAENILCSFLLPSGSSVVAASAAATFPVWVPFPLSKSPKGKTKLVYCLSTQGYCFVNKWYSFFGKKKKKDKKGLGASMCKISF